MADIYATLWITFKLASVTTVLLLLLGTPLAWWLARGRDNLRSGIESLVAIPLVLPPTVLGFYLLIAFAPDNVLGSGWQTLTGQPLAFTFSALVIGSMLYSLPFVVQPLQAAFRALPNELLEAAATLGANRHQRWTQVVLPLCRRSFVVAASLGFAHTVGEFGVVLMIGGNIPGETQVLSIALYDQVEALNYQRAHWMAGGLLLFSFIMLFTLYRTNRSTWKLQ